MALKTIISLLEKKIGLSANAIGSKTLVKTVQNRMDARGLSDRKAYLAYLQESKEEWEALIESVVVTETWFFRTKESFAFLGQYVKSEWLPTSQNKVLRVLSIPCATGEEPYSIAMTLLEAGLPKEQLYIDGVDINKKVVYKASVGVYGEESFRNKEALLFRERFFKKTANGYYIHPSLKSSIRFIEGNLLDSELLINEKPYQIIFCRNLLIYYNRSARKQAMSVVNRLLTDTGLLFVGHAERSLFDDSRLIWFRQPGVFACQKVEASHKSEETTPVEIVEQERIGKIIPSITPLSKEKAPDRSYPQHSQKQVQPPAGITFERRKNRKREGEGHGALTPVERRTRHDEHTTLLDTARKLADQGSLEEAFNLCKKVLSNDAIHIQAHFLMGLLYQALRNDGLAEEYFSKTVYLDPHHLEALNHLSFIAEQQGDQEKAGRLRQRTQRILQRQKSD